jgi:hypothetical protein
MDGRHLLHEKAIERHYVRVGKFDVGRIRHRRIEAVAVLGNAMARRELKIGKTVATDAGLGIRRDVGLVNGAEGRPHFETAGEPLAARNRVTSDAISGPRQILVAITGADASGVTQGGLVPGRQNEASEYPACAKHSHPA